MVFKLYFIKSIYTQNKVKLKKNVFVKDYARNCMISFKHALILIFKHQTWLSSKVNSKNLIDDNVKLHAHLQTMIKEPAKFQIDRYKTLGGVAHIRYLR